MSTKVTQKGLVSSIVDDDKVIVNAGGAVKQIKVSDLRTSLNQNQQQVLESLAFYIDINQPSSKGANRVDVGGNMHMQAIWAANRTLALMDKNGNYAELNPNDARYTADGELIIDTETLKLTSSFENADVVEIIPEYYGAIQTVTVGSSTILRPWFSPVPLPGGFTIPQMVVGKEKGTIINGALRSVPGYVPSANQTINSFWNYAQARSKNHGLANADFRDYLLFYMMSSYSWRSSQECQNSDGTVVWGVGLDGTENNGGFAGQSGIIGGRTLSLGINDGKVAETDANGNTCHSVNVAGFANAWGQYWEMVQGLCSVANDVYRWRSNWMPTGTPTATSFTNIPHVVLTRSATSGLTTPGMNIVESGDGMGVYMVPKESKAGINYGDYYWYAANGQLWLFGGASYYGSRCGLASADSSDVWSVAYSNIAARLAYYGDVTKVTTQRLKELLAA